MGYDLKRFSKPPFNRGLILTVIVVSLGIGFAGGFLFGKTGTEIENIGGLRELINKNHPKEEEAVDFKLFWTVWDTIHEKYVDKEKLTTQDLVYGAISGMVDSIGDPFTSFMKPAESKKFQEEIKGEFSGVGMEIGIRKNQLTVISPIKDTPAYKAGIKAGDKILKIDDKDTSALNLQEAVSLIRGKRGTQVTLTITRNGLDKTKEFIITRDTIKIPTVTLDFIGNDQNIAHLQIYSFNQNADADFRKAAQQILSSNIDKIILDLRNNPGGLLDSSVYIASWFLNSGDIITIEKFGDGREIPFKAENIGSLKHLPVVILVNKGSASASEILAGALKDQRSIKVIGEKTFGKGSVQELFEMPQSKTSLKVTVAKWLTPKGTSINDEGITPDIEIEKKEEDAENDKDPQLDKAIDIISKMN